MYQDNLLRELIIDNFAGGGGASTGIELALGVPVSDLLFIAQIVGDNPRLLEDIKNGYSFGHAVGYVAGRGLFEKKIHEAIRNIATEPLRFEQGDGFDFTKVKFEIPPYKQHDEVINMARLYGVPVYTPKVINVVNPSTDGDDNK